MALQRRWREQQLYDDMRAGVLAATIANFSMGRDPNQPPLQPGDFFPSLPTQTDDQQEMSFEDMVAILRISEGPRN